MLRDVSFVTSSFLRKKSGARASIVGRSISSWIPLLELDFHTKIFVDDRSLHCIAACCLDELGMMSMFDQVHYVSFDHPPHSNYGIAYCYEVSRSKYVLRLDDDVSVRYGTDKLTTWLSRAVSVLESDCKIQGINLLTLDKNDGSQKAWEASNKYDGQFTAHFAHPEKYFGTCASIVRRELLTRMTLADIRAYGDTQPTWWERYVSFSPQEFLVANGDTPFVVDIEAWQHTATKRNPILNGLRAISRNLTL